MTPTILQLNWLKLREKNVYDICVFMFKIVKNDMPDWFMTSPTVGDVLETRTRQSRDLFIQPNRTDLAGNAFVNKGPRQWNQLPDYFKDIQSLDIFKGFLKNLLLARQAAN